MANDDILTARELAEYLKIAEKTAYRFASDGKVPGFKVGSAWRFRKSEIERWISEQEQKQEGVKNDRQATTRRTAPTDLEHRERSARGR